MASVVKDEKSTKAEDEDERDHADETEAREDRDKPPPHVATATREEGFFHIYKSGQGYWTRMGTALAAGFIAALTANFLYGHMHVWLTPLFTPKGPTSAQNLA